MTCLAMRLGISTAVIVLLYASSASAADNSAGAPWTTKSLSADMRADLLAKAMTPDERNALLHGAFPMMAKSKPADMMSTGGYIPGVPRIGLPSIQESDASLGVANPGGMRKGDGATALPSGLATAASWDPAIAYQSGAMIGSEARKKGFAVLLAGGVNLARDPRNGRNFEYVGEDPLLAGSMAGEAIRGIQDQHIVSTTKHFALNDQETGRHVLDAQIGEADLRESDLLAFEIAIERGKPASVMCSYNKVNGAYACADQELLTGVLRRDWGYTGWVMSDWGAVPDPAESALAGLDQESGSELDQLLFKHTLADSIQQSQIPEQRLGEMAHRYLSALFASGVMDDPPAKGEIDYEADRKVAQRAEEAGAVLLANRNGILPLGVAARKIAVIGGRADLGVLSGGGSSQVIPVGGPALKAPLPVGAQKWLSVIYHPSSPLKAITAEASSAEVNYDPGTDVTVATALAAKSDIAIVFATQWMAEEYDAPSLSLPDDQDKLIEAVAAANPHTIVVLETGNPVLMPWLGHVGAVLEAWYPGAGGGEAIARILFGKTNPTGRLPITFPQAESQLPRPVLPGSDQPPIPYPGAPEKPFDVKYVEGSDVGYRWYTAKGLKPLFPFGYGLSYTTFEHKNFSAHGGDTISAEFDMTNNGSRIGADTVQLYAEMPSRIGQLTRRLIGWSKVELKLGETRHLSIKADPRLLASFDSRTHRWQITGGPVRLHLATNAEDVGLEAIASIKPATMKP